MTEDDSREETIVTTIRLSRDQHDQLRDIAALEHRSMGGEIRRLISDHISAYQQNVGE